MLSLPNAAFPRVCSMGFQFNCALRGGLFSITEHFQRVEVIKNGGDVSRGR